MTGGEAVMPQHQAAAIIVCAALGASIGDTLVHIMEIRQLRLGGALLALRCVIGAVTLISVGLIEWSLLAS